MEKGGGLSVHACPSGRLDRGQTIYRTEALMGRREGKIDYLERSGLGVHDVGLRLARQQHNAVRIAPARLHRD